MVGKDEDLRIEIFSCFKKPGQPVFLKVAKAEDPFLSDFDEEREGHLVGMLSQGQVFNLIRVDNAQNDIFRPGQPQQLSSSNLADDDSFFSRIGEKLFSVFFPIEMFRAEDFSDIQ